MRRSRTTVQLTRTALIAALYVVFSLLPPFNAITYGAIQFRLGEALVVLPFVLDEAVPGVILGCLITNLFSPFGLIDIIIGTSVTAAAAVLTHLLRRTHQPWAAALPPIVLNATIIPAYVSTLTLPAAGHLELRQHLFGGLAFVFAHLSWGVYAPVALSILLGETTVVLAVGLPVLGLVTRVLHKAKEES